METTEFDPELMDFAVSAPIQAAADIIGGNKTFALLGGVWNNDGSPRIIGIFAANGLEEAAHVAGALQNAINSFNPTPTPTV